MAKAMTAKSVELVKPGTKRREVPDAVVPGLHLVVQPSGKKSWAVRFRQGGRSRKVTLGSYPALSLAEARDDARQVLQGRPPRAKQDTVALVAEQFVERHASKNKWGWETERQLRREVLPAWGNRRVGDISRRDVIELLDGIADRGSPIMANRVLATIRKMYAWALSRDIVQQSPCAGVAMPAREVSRDRVLSDAELRSVLLAANALGYPFGPLTWVLALTGTRLREAANARWSEFDLESRVWLIPAARSKNGEAHSVPVSPQLAALLGQLPRIGTKFVFTTSGEAPVSGFATMKERIDDIVGIPDWHVHDLRRSVATKMAEIGVAIPVVEKVLGHRSGVFRGIVGTYQRHSFDSEKRAALEAWADRVDSILAEGADNVAA